MKELPLVEELKGVFESIFFETDLALPKMKR